MDLNKFNKSSDGIADIYRAALYLARGNTDIGARFLDQAKVKAGEKFIGPFLSGISFDKIKTRRQQLFWAEKVLDQYLRLKNL
jgi:hypothetical protein